MDHVDQPARLPRPTTSVQLSPEIIVAAIIGVFVLALGGLASRAEPDHALTPLVSAEDRLYYLVALILTGAAGVASTVIRVTEAGAPTGPSRWVRPSAVLPALTVAGASLLFTYTTNWGIILLMALGAGVITWLAIWTESRITSRQPVNLRDEPAPLVHLAITVGVGLLFLSVVYGFRMNMRYTAPLAFLATGALFAQALAFTSGPRRYIPQTLAGALLLTELAWVLVYWDVAAWHGGAILGLGFYTLLAVVGGYLGGDFQTRDLVRQALISAPVLALLILLAR